MRVLLVAMLLLTTPAWAQPDTQARAIELMRKVDDMYRGTSSKGRMSMHIKTAHWERTLTMEMASYGEDYTLMRIISPRKEKGTATLKIDKEIYNYLPKTDRTIKISSGMMGGSWMGSHFTNDDLVQESRLSEDFKLSITFEGERDGQQVIEITLIPKPDAAVVWGKIISVIRASDSLPVVSSYFDEDMELVRTMTFTDVKTMAGRTIPTVMRLQPTDKPDEFTEIRYIDIAYDVGLDKSYFNLQRLKRMR